MIIAPKEITRYNVYIAGLHAPPKGYVRKLNGKVVHGNIIHSHVSWMWAWGKIGDYISEADEIYELDKNTSKMSMHIQKMRANV